MEKEILINIGYDKVRQCFIVYNTDANIVTVGSSVLIAKQKFKEIAKDKKLSVIDDD